MSECKKAGVRHVIVLGVSDEGAYIACENCGQIFMEEQA
jgi:hypothetical protein